MIENKLQTLSQQEFGVLKQQAGLKARVKELE